MIHLEKHQKYAIITYLVLVGILFSQDHPQEELIRRCIILFVFLLGILTYRFLTFIHSIGFLPGQASDAKNYKTGPFAFLFWIGFIIAGYNLVL